jgi:ribosomal protein S12 methylthiotransferase
MKRGTTREKTYELLKNFRSQVPGIAIRTTLITGYPGETAEDHEQMKQFIKDIQFDRLGVFTYSHEENTTAFKLKDNVPMELKQERASDLMEIQQGISYELNQQKIGKTFKVLFDKTENGFFIGRTEFDSPEVDNEVMVDTKNNFVRLGDFANVQIESAEEFDLVGNVIV